MNIIHSFAKQFAKEQGYELKIGNKDILRYPGKLYEIPILNPLIRISQNDQQATIKKIYDLDSLRRLGLTVVSITPKKKWFFGQKKEYRIERIGSGLPELPQMPDHHIIEYDMTNKKIRLRGKNAGPWGYGGWFYLTRNRQTLNSPATMNIKNPQKMRDAIRKKYLPGKQVQQLQKIKIRETDMPITITEENELLCMPEMIDEPVCGIIGMRGGGKSFFMNSLAGRFFWYAGKRVGIINDKLAETGPWCMPWGTDPIREKSVAFIQQLQKLNETPLPLPAIYLHPNTNNLKRLIHPHEVGFKISWSFRDMIDNYNYYFRNKTEWKLEKSLKYFRNIKDALIECKTIDEVQEVIDQGVPEDQNLSKQRIMGVIEDIFNQKILDIQTGIPAEWTFKGKGMMKKYRPFVACLAANLVPILVTNNFQSKDYFPEYFNYIVRDIIQKQTDDEYFIRNQIKLMIMCDEITMLTSKNNKTAATEILGELAAEGRPQRIGFTWVTQNPEKIEDRITTNTNYQFIFRVNNREQANAVVKGFDLPKERLSDILNLRKFEMLACTTEKFVAYDLSTGERKVLEGEARKGFALPPLNQHKAPSTI